MRVAAVVAALAATQWAAAAPPESSAAAKEALGNALGAALLAEMPRGLQSLRAVAATQFTRRDAIVRSCMLQRFGSRAGSHGKVNSPKLSTAFARKTLALYERYWHEALLNPTQREQAELRMFQQLRSLVGAHNAPDMAALEPELAKLLLKSGYHSLQGRTGQLRELMMWSRQEERTYKVALPEGEHSTRVMLLDDFASLGWSAYATCGRASTAGWATSEALFAVVSRYPGLESEEFRVSFLGHETQHFADYTRFPKLQPWELEFRAKLVELAQANTARANILGRFTSDQGDDTGSPHAYANKRVLAAMWQGLGLAAGADLATQDLQRLQAAAAQALRDDTQRRTDGAPLR